jgi:hypothetical protein
MTSTQIDVRSRVQTLRNLAARARALDAALPGRPDAAALLDYAGDLEREADDLEAVAAEGAAPPADFCEGEPIGDLPALFRAAEAAGVPFHPE